MNGWFIFFKRRLQLVILSYHLKILFCFSFPLLSSLASSLLQSACLLTASSSTALSQEGGVGRSTHWYDPVNELCHGDEAGGLEGLLCTAGFKHVVKTSWNNRVHLASQLSSPRMAPSWQCFLSFSRARQLAWAEGLVRCSKVPTRWSSMCVAWARNWKRRARWGLLTPQVLLQEKPNEPLPSIRTSMWLESCDPLPPSFVEKLTPSRVKKPLWNHTGQVLACCKKRSESLLKLKGF